MGAKEVVVGEWGGCAGSLAGAGSASQKVGLGWGGDCPMHRPNAVLLPAVVSQQAGRPGLPANCAVSALAGTYLWEWQGVQCSAAGISAESRPALPAAAAQPLLPNMLQTLFLPAGLKTTARNFI